METEVPIVFTQFLFPQGHRHQVAIDRPRSIAEKAAALLDRGWKFEIENREDRIWMSALLGEDIRVDRFCFNDFHVLLAVDEMICEAFEKYIPKENSNGSKTH